MPRDYAYQLIHFVYRLIPKSYIGKIDNIYETCSISNILVLDGKNREGVSIFQTMRSTVEQTSWIFNP